MADFAAWEQAGQSGPAPRETSRPELTAIELGRAPHSQTLDPPDIHLPDFHGTQLVMQILDYGSNARGDEIWRFRVDRRHRKYAEPLRDAVQSMVSVDIQPYRRRLAAMGKDPGPDGHADGLAER